MRKSFRMPAILLPGLLGAAAVCAAAPDVLLQGGSPRPVSLQAIRAGQPAIVVFWRSDCAPCRQELEKLPALRREAWPLRLLLVDVESAPSSNGGGPAAGVPDSTDAFRALGEPARTLADFGGNPPRLPLSVLLDGTGKVRAKRIGEIGPLLVREWRLRQIGKQQESLP